MRETQKQNPQHTVREPPGDPGLRLRDCFDQRPTGVSSSPMRGFGNRILLGVCHPAPFKFKPLTERGLRGCASRRSAVRSQAAAPHGTLTWPVAVRWRMRIAAVAVGRLRSAIFGLFSDAARCGHRNSDARAAIEYLPLFRHLDMVSFVSRPTFNSRNAESGVTQLLSRQVF
jgi:hypothetical protein